MRTPPILLMALASSVLAASIVLLPAIDPPVTSGGSPLCGDVNSSGTINSIDAVLVLQFEAAIISSLSGASGNPEATPTTTPSCSPVGDVNGDSSVNSVDAALILQLIVQRIDTLPPPPGPTPPPPAVGGVGIGSLALELAAQGYVEVGVQNVTSPGLGAWTIDVAYDASIVSVETCDGESGSVCNRAFGPSTIRIAGARAFGVEGNGPLASIKFECVGSGSSGLLISLPVFADATTGGPQAMDASIQDGAVTCGPAPTATPAPTETPEATPTPVPTEVPVPTEEPAHPVGDVNCSGDVNSIDASLILQFDAGLIPSLPIGPAC